MKFTAIETLTGKKVEGVGVCISEENIDNWVVEDTETLEKNIEKYGKELSYLFTDSIDWIDGVEFKVSKFEIVFSSSVKAVK